MSFERRTTRRAAIYRTTIAAGKRDPDDATLHLSDLACTPAYPADVGRLGELLQADVIQSLYHVFEVFVAGCQNIVAGDLLELAGVRYIVRAVAKWNRARGGDYMHLTVELMKG